MSNRKVNTVELDFDQIKHNLKLFLQGQDRFSDYDFDGSNMSVLLDVLAYNSHYNAMYTNMALNEVFLDSASRRDSVVSLAKSVGYLPRSSVCAKANINFVVTEVSDSPEFLTVVRNTPFYGTKDGERFTLYTVSDTTVQKNSNGQYIFAGIDLIEGMPAVAKFEYTEHNVFIIPNNAVDITTIRVRVQESPNSTTYTSHTYAATLDEVGPESDVFFIKEVDGGFHQLYFGDNVLGRQLSIGNLITVEYFSCNGENPNGISSLSYGGASFNGGTVVNITMNDRPVNGGRDPETTEEIRFNAPNFYASQNRAVTALDYEAILLSQAPSIEAVSVWGGENNNPPIYGKVFISAKTVGNRNLTTAEQIELSRTVLDRYKVVSVLPEFVNPEYIEVELDVVAYYDATMTTRSADDLKTSITNALLNYNNSDLKKFNRILRQSTVSRLVEMADPSIISSVPRMKLYRTVTPIYNTEHTYTVNVGNPFTPGTILTSGVFIANYPHTCYIDDDGEGVLNLFAIVSGSRVDLRPIGLVDYAAGSLAINSFNIVRTLQDNLTIAATPASADIASIFNQIVMIDPAKLKVNMVADQTTRGQVLVGNRFQFVQSKI